MTAKDISDYLGSMHRDETIDPDQKWVNTHNTKALCISKFYRWKAYPHLNPQQRKTLPKDQLPPVLDGGLTFVARKGSRSPVKAKDIWTDQDTALFLKYCTEDKRLACYHSLAIDTSARPDELLQLKIGDIEIKKTSDESGDRLYASLDIGRHSKKKRSRIVPMINSIAQKTIIEDNIETIIGLSINEGVAPTFQVHGSLGIDQKNTATGETLLEFRAGFSDRVNENTVTVTSRLRSASLSNSITVGGFDFVSDESRTVTIDASWIKTGQVIAGPCSFPRTGIIEGCTFRFVDATSSVDISGDMEFAFEDGSGRIEQDRFTATR